MNSVILKSKPEKMNDMIIENVSVITEDEIYENAWIRISEGKITEICSCDITGKEKRVNGTGKYLLPGFIDLYCNMLENYFQSGQALLHLDFALREADRVLAASGITTAFYGVSFPQPGNKEQSNGNTAGKLIREIARVKKFLNVNTLVHAELDTMQAAEVPLLLQAIIEEHIHWLSLKNQTHQKEWPAGREIAGLIDTSRILGIPIALFGADSLNAVRQARQAGIRISAFPAANEAIQAAAFLCMQILTALPDYMPGNTPSAGSFALSTLLTGDSRIICSNKHPGSLVQAVNLLYGIDCFSLPEIIKMVSLNPATTAGIDDERGSIETGKCADLILADLSQGVISIVETFINGTPVQLNQFLIKQS